MTPNQPPVAEIVVPDEGFRAMETEVIPIRALVSDDLDSNEDLVIEWNVVIGQTSVMKLFDEQNNITDLEAGLYVLTLEVTDKQGVSTTDSLSFEITLLDSDGDWTATCNDDYYDKENNLNCGQIFMIQTTIMTGHSTIEMYGHLIHVHTWTQTMMANQTILIVHLV